jgi:dihydroorotate dehydrogenase (NAD+) catalytic subunit
MGVINESLCTIFSFREIPRLGKSGFDIQHGFLLAIFLSSQTISGSEMSSLSVRIAGMDLDNPTMLASGIMGETGPSLVKMAEWGAGALVTKSIGIEPRYGYSNPTLVELPFGYLNCMGLPNPGIEAFGDEMNIASTAKIPIVGSIFASNEDGFAELAGRMEDYGAYAVELNLSCPHAEGYGMELGTDPETVRSIVSAVKGSISIPVFAKVTPNTEKLVDVGKAVQEGGGDAVVAINTVKAMFINVEMKRPVLSNITGGLSGPAIRPIGVRCVYELYEALDIPLIGVGGIENWRDALEYIMAGATAIQVGSALGRKGLDTFREILGGIENFMNISGFNSIESMVGIAHE